MLVFTSKRCDSLILICWLFFSSCSQQQIQDAADQGVMFVGFVQEPYGAPCTRIREPDTPSLSLHSSPSSVLGSLGSCSPTNHGAHAEAVDKEGVADSLGEAPQEAPGGEENQTGNHSGPGVDDVSPAVSPVSDGDLEQHEDVTEEDSPCHNNNTDSGRDTKERPRYRPRRGDGECSLWFPS